MDFFMISNAWEELSSHDTQTQAVKARAADFHESRLPRSLDPSVPKPCPPEVCHQDI